MTSEQKCAMAAARLLHLCKEPPLDVRGCWQVFADLNLPPVCRVWRDGVPMGPTVWLSQAKIALEGPDPQTAVLPKVLACIASLGGRDRVVALCEQVSQDFDERARDARAAATFMAGAEEVP